MRRITLWSLSTLTTLVLLFSYHTSTSARSSTAASPVIAQGATPGAVPTPEATTPSDTSTSSSSAARTYAGDATSTRYGDVQVQITVKNGRITASKVLQVPWNDSRDQEINSSAVPILNQEAVSAQSSAIDMVSGATFTSDGYMQSLQSAIDRAHL